MAQYISPEQRAKILSAIKDEGMSIPDVAKTFLVAEKTVRRWLRKQTHNAHTSSTEVQKLREENQAPKAMILKEDFLWALVEGVNSISFYGHCAGLRSNIRESILK